MAPTLIVQDKSFIRLPARGGAVAELVAVPLENGGVIVVEMDHAQAGVVKAGRPGQIVGKAAQTLEAALESVTPAAQSILAKLRPARPHEITVEFGLTLTAEAGALRWERDDDRAG